MKIWEVNKTRESIAFLKNYSKVCLMASKTNDDFGNEAESDTLFHESNNIKAHIKELEAMVAEGVDG